MITKKEIQYGAFGKCLEISNGLVQVLVTLDFGPRIIRYSFVDGENIMFEDPERTFFHKGEDMDKAYGKGATWYTYGGHRLWASPESVPKTNYPDNNPVQVELTDSGAVFTAPEQIWNQQINVVAVSLAEDSTEVTVKHSIINTAAWPVTLAPWPITVVGVGGVEVIPQASSEPRVQPNRVFALWTYTNPADPRLTWMERYIAVKQMPEYTKPFKIGLNNPHGFALYFNHGDVFVKQFDVVQNGNYPDGGVSYETYTNRLFLEMESLGELKTLKTGEKAEHVERWSLYKGELPAMEDAALDEAVKQYVR